MSTAQAMKTQEVAAVLDRSAEQVQRYRKQGHLKATKNGRDWLFDRESVFAFARSRGIHPVERRGGQGQDFFQHYAEMLKCTPPGAEISYKAPAPASKA